MAGHVTVEILTGGTLHYSRTITLPADVAKRIRESNGVVVVHGTDYDHSGIYSGVLDRSELNKGVPGTATAPALCGPLKTAANTTTASAHGHTLVYTAVLKDDPAIPLSELFLCEAGATAPAAAESRRGLASAGGSTA